MRAAGLIVRMLLAALLVLGTVMVPDTAAPPCANGSVACLDATPADAESRHGHDHSRADTNGPDHAHEAMTPRDKVARPILTQVARMAWAAPAGLPPAPSDRMERPPRMSA